MESNKNVCGVCTIRESDVNKLIFCAYCFSCGHLKCKNILGRAIQRIREKRYFCTLDCADKYTRIINMQSKQESQIVELGKELRNTVANELKTVRTNVTQFTSAIESAQEFFSSKLDKILSDLKNMKKENVALKKEIELLKSSHSSVSTTAFKLESDFDRPAKAAVTRNAIVLGVPFKPKKNVVNVVNKMFEVMNCKSESLVSVSRLQANNKSTNALPPVRIIFKDEASKENMFQKLKRMKGIPSTKIDPDLTLNGKTTNITVQHELTHFSLNLLQETRKNQKLFNWKYVWADKNGSILVRKAADDNIYTINNRSDLNKLVSAQRRIQK